MNASGHLCTAFLWGCSYLLKWKTCSSSAAGETGGLGEPVDYAESSQSGCIFRPNLGLSKSLSLKKRMVSFGTFFLQPKSPAEKEAAADVVAVRARSLTLFLSQFAKSCVCHLCSRRNPDKGEGWEAESYENVLSLKPDSFCDLIRAF